MKYSDEEFLFRQTSKERKSIASGAYHKKSGGKTKFVGLPSDHLTPAQLKKLNGPVLTLRVDEPMTKDEFFNLSDEHARIYLGHLRQKYHASLSAVASMLGYKSNGSFHNLLKRRGLLGEFDKSSYHMDFAQKMAWQEFLTKKDKRNEELTEPTESAEPVAEPVTAQPVEVVRVVPEGNHPGLVSIDIEFCLERTADFASLKRYFDMIQIPEGIPSKFSIRFIQKGE